MLTIDNTALIIIDVQEKLFRVIDNREALLENLQKIISGARVLGIPHAGYRAEPGWSWRNST